MKERMLREVRAEIMRATGRRYPALYNNLELLDEPSLRDLFRLLRDLADEKTMALNRARREPWRR